jgi:predicted DCC family thiol-disulfide oxidoreductase YuxK
MATGDHELFYDRNCGFCRRLLTLALRWDSADESRLSPVALQDERTIHRLAPLNETERMASWHMRKPDGEIVSGGAALPELLDVVHKHRAAARFMRATPRLTDFGYRWIAGHRTFAGRVTRHWPMFHEPTGRGQFGT